ncbi:MAG: DUF917 domain-containing protein, partial [Candidatus Bipolaricaulota bacterium]
MTTRPLSDPADLDALLAGLGIMGTGGGGDPKGWGRSVFAADTAAGRSYLLADPSDIPDDAFVLSGGYLGSVADDHGLDRLLEGWEEDFELERAIRILEEEHGKDVDYLVAFELGGGNTPVVMSCAARLGIPVIDGDGVGRAAPETHMCSFLGHGISLTPMPLVGQDGTVVLVRDGDLFLADDIGRCVAGRAQGFLANAHYGMSGAELKRCVVPDTITRALDLGRLVRSLGPSDDPLAEICDFMGGAPLIRGRVVSREEIAQQGFFVAHLGIEGVSEDEGTHLDLVVKNEVMCAKRDGKPLVLFPDLLYILDPTTGEGLMTPELVTGCDVAVLAA